MLNLLTAKPRQQPADWWQEHDEQAEAADQDGNQSQPNAKYRSK